MQALYIVEMTEDEQAELENLLRGGVSKVRTLKRAQILVASNGWRKTDEEVAAKGRKQRWNCNRDDWVVD